MAKLNPTHQGVLVPDDMLGASVAELDAYAESVKAGNRAFIATYWDLMERAELLDVDLETER